MAVQWEKVHVFVSSTFNDMHGERDYLVKQVFPRLQEWCERRKLRLVDIDLRWGVTEADAAENKRVVQVCLERIDACRPFFLCFLGQRRGWVPEKDDISPETFATYPELAKYAGGASVTELEILHALVDPLHRGKVVGIGGAREYAPTEHSFFYLRGRESLAGLPPDVPQLREIYTNEGIKDPEGRRRADEQLECWRTQEIPATRRPVHPYQAHWDAGEFTPEIRLPLHCPSTAEPGSHTWRVAFDQWSDRWADAGVRVDEDGTIGDAVERDKADRFNARLAQGRLAAFACGGAPLADTILADLESAIEARYPDHIEAAGLTPLQRELDQQAQLLRAAGEGFIERAGDFSALDDYVRDDSTRPFFLTAPGGLGKTSLLARWIDRAQQNLKTGESLHYRFIGASDGSTALDALLRSLLSEIQEVTAKLPEEIPGEPQWLRALLPWLLEAVGTRGRTVLVLDGLNQLESGLGDLSWLPLVLPPGIKLIASFKRGEPLAEAYLERLRAGGEVILAEVRPFVSLEDRRQLVAAYLSQFLKELDERHVEELIRSEGAGNPLYLKIVLAELRVFGAFADLGEKIRSSFGTTPVSAFAGLLRRLEGDPAYSPVRQQLLVPRLLGWLAHSRTGLTAVELGELLVREGLLDDGGGGRQKAVEAVYGLLRQLRPYLSLREARSDFFYESLKLAVLERYARRDGQPGLHPESRQALAWHASLAGYFQAQPLRLGEECTPNRHTLTELAYQLAHAGMAVPLQQTLWQYQYLQARLECSGAEELIADYHLADLEVAGLSSEERLQLRLLQQALRLSAHMLSRDARQLPGQLTGRLLGFEGEKIRGLLDAAHSETTHPWLRPLSPSLDAPGGALLRTLVAHTTVVEGVALTPDGQLALSASRDGTLRLWDIPNARVLRTLAGSTPWVWGVALTADARLAVSAGRAHFLTVWDVASGKPLRALNGHADLVYTAALSADGRLAVSASWDRTLKVWDVESGKPLRTLTGHTLSVNDVALSADGRVAVSASDDGTLKVWDVASGSELRTLRGHATAVTTVALAPDGRLAVSGSFDTTLKVWDVDSGELLNTLVGHGRDVTDVALTADGRLALSASEDQTLKAWDLTSGQELCTLTGHTGAVTSVALAADGRLGVSASWDGTLKVWDLASAQRRGVQARHADRLTALALAEDGQLAVSGSTDRTLIVWDVASGQVLRTLADAGQVTAVALRHDGRLAVSASKDETLKVWDVASGHLLHTLAGHDGTVNAVALTPDGTLAVSASWDRTLKVWDLAGGRLLSTLRGHKSPVVGVVLTLGGHSALSWCADGTLRVWDLAGANERRCMAGNGNISAVAPTRDERLAVVASGARTLKVWELASGREVRQLSGEAERVARVVVTPDGRLAVSAADSTITVWDLASGRQLRTLTGHTDWVTALAVMPGGRLLASADDRQIKVWNLESGDALTTYVSEGSGVIFAVAADGQLIAVGDSSGRVRFFRLVEARRGE